MVKAKAVSQPKDGLFKRLIKTLRNLPKKVKDSASEKRKKIRLFSRFENLRRDVFENVKKFRQRFSKIRVISRVGDFLKKFLRIKIKENDEDSNAETKDSINSSTGSTD